MDIIVFRHVRTSVANLGSVIYARACTKPNVFLCDLNISSQHLIQQLRLVGAWNPGQGECLDSRTSQLITTDRLVREFEPVELRCYLCTCSQCPRNSLWFCESSFISPLWIRPLHFSSLEENNFILPTYLHLRYVPARNRCL